MDYLLWNKFLTDHGKDYSGFDYDVKVGQGTAPVGPVPKNLESDFLSLTKKRIDAVGYQPDGVTLFEVKPRAGTTALGQLIAYSDLYRQTFPLYAIKDLAIVTAFLNRDETGIYEKYGVKIFIYA